MATQTIQPPGLLRIVVRLGEDRVVVVAGVGRVDGDQRQVAQVGAARRGSAARRLPPRPRRRRRSRWGCRGRGWRSARRRGDRPRGRPPPAPCRAWGHSGARRRRRPGPAPGRRPSGRAPRTRGSAGCPWSGGRPARPRTSRARLAHHAQDAVGALAQPLDQPRLDLAGLQRLEAHQQPVAEARRAGGLLAAVGREARPAARPRRPWPAARRGRRRHRVRPRRRRPPGESRRGRGPRERGAGQCG